MVADILLVAIPVFIIVRAVTMTLSFKVLSEITVIQSVHENFGIDITHADQIKQPLSIFLLSLLRFLLCPVVSPKQFGDGRIHIRHGLYTMQLRAGSCRGKYWRACAVITECGPEPLRGKLVVVDRKRTYTVPEIEQ